MSKTTEFFCNHYVAIGVAAGLLIGIIINAFLWDFRIENGKLTGNANIGRLSESFSISSEGYDGGYTWDNDEIYRITIG